MSGSTQEGEGSMEEEWKVGERKRREEGDLRGRKKRGGEERRKRVEEDIHGEGKDDKKRTEGG